MLHVIWHPPVELGNMSDKLLNAALEDTDNLEDFSGIYVFGRQHGRTFDTVYVGKAGNMRIRIKQQMNNFKLMVALKNSGAGKKKILLGEFRGGPGPGAAKNLKLLERALIEFAMTSGCELINKQGTKLKFKEIKFAGKKNHHLSFPRRMNVRVQS